MNVWFNREGDNIDGNLFTCPPSQKSLLQDPSFLPLVCFNYLKVHHNSD